MVFSPAILAVLLLLILLLFILLGCSSEMQVTPPGEAVASTSSASPAGNDGADAAARRFPATATPWPTFTPAPTPTMTPVPAPTQRPAPTPTPWPRRSAPSDIVPGPTPVERLGAGSPGGPEDFGVYLVKQSLVPFWGEQLPDYLTVMDWDRMPETTGVVSPGIPYMLWVVVFDFSEADSGYEIDGIIRWWSISRTFPPVIMFETPVVLSERLPFFYHGLGGDDLSVWTPGLYRVEFLDGRRSVIARAKFEVRS